MKTKQDFPALFPPVLPSDSPSALSSFLRPSPDDVVLTGVGVLSGLGLGFTAHAAQVVRFLDVTEQDSGEGPVGSDQITFQRDLTTFDPVPHLSDRRMMKAVSHFDALGLVAIDDLKKAIYRGGSSGYDPRRIGLYVGSPPAYAEDNENYMVAVGACAVSVEAGEAGDAAAGGKAAEVAEVGNSVSMDRFGKACMECRPNTLLLGLPNNVLCYGAMLLDARGPNSNYTSGETSGMLAVTAAARRVRRGLLDLGVAGAFSSYHERVLTSLLLHYGLTRPGTTSGDGAIFLAIERRGAAAGRGAVPLATIIGEGAANAPLTFATTKEQPWAWSGVDEEESSETIRQAVSQCFGRASDRGGTEVAAQGSSRQPHVPNHAPTQESLAQIGLVLAGASGNPPTDQREYRALAGLWPAGERPALATLGALTGNMMEAGGLSEIAFGGLLYHAAAIPSLFLPHLSATTSPFATAVDKTRPLTLVVRTSAWGEVCAMLVRHEAHEG